MTTMGRRVVYTCLFGYSERFSDYEYGDRSVDYICFTDNPSLRSKHRQIRHFSNPLLDSHRLSKSFKHLPHRYLSEYDRSLYIDNIVRLKKTPAEIFDLFPEDLAILKHPDRDCVYDEAIAVTDLQIDDRKIIKKQMGFYRDIGYPKHNGLNATTFLLRNHNLPKLVVLNEDWHTQVLRYSKRDQLSWNVCAWVRGFHYREIDQHPEHNTLFEWPVVRGGVRLPRDFDDDLYLSMHPDVKQSGMDPRMHYLTYGHQEDRRYKPLREHLKNRLISKAYRAKRRISRMFPSKL
jgi:hypothetical protein